MDFILAVVDALLEGSGAKEKLGRSEQVIRLKQRFGLEDIESLAKFENVYAYALVEYAFDEVGLCKHRLLVDFFKAKAVRDVFRVAYRDNNPAEWLGKGQAIAQYELGDKLPVGIDPKRELGVFAAVFLEVVKGTRSPKEIRQDQKIDGLRGDVLRSLQTIQTQLQQLPTLEAINQQVNQLSGTQSASKKALPAAAQNSNAADLAHRLGEWFEVLDYDRDPDYEEWTEDYFEWVINFPLTRRKFSRTLVRGVAGVVEMADLQDFAQAVERTGADEGWLVGNRRVSQATRQAVQEKIAYEDISCYTFDELLDEDADFSRYLDWLEAEIKAKQVDTEYLPLACRKDELDPTSQRKIGVSTYDEDDGWIDGYVDMWLDDPAKEHLSVLGEFGTGKTWFVLHYAWMALQRYRQAKQRGTERPRIPVVVPLRDYAKSVTVESLFSEFFFRKHEILKNYSVFERLNRMGKLLLIFDGFDEMAARVNRQEMIDNFWELAKVVVPGAKAILTCRTEHFPNAIEGRKLLNAELESSTAKLTGETPQFEVLELEKFNDAQIEQLLSRKAQAATVQMVLGNSQLLDLARRPVMVDLILEAMPDIEAGKPVDMARVYLYAVTRKMKTDIKSERTFTSMADKLYFLCELSWEMLSTNRMSLNYRAFPERLQQMFVGRLQEENELDHWRYDMMGQTMLIRNSEGDYSPAHRSLLEFFVAYKIVASLGAMAEDFMAVARDQSHLLDETLPSKDYTWDTYFRRECDEKGEPVPMAKLCQFAKLTFDELLPLLGRTKLAKAVLDLAHPMLETDKMSDRLLPFLQATASKTLKESGCFGGNIAQLMLSKTPFALSEASLRNVKLEGVDFSHTYLRGVDFRKAQLAEVSFSKVLSFASSVSFSPDNNYLAIGDGEGILQVWNIVTNQAVLFLAGHEELVQSVAYSPDGQQIASAGDDNKVKIWNAETGKCIHSIEAHEDWVGSVVYSPNGQQIASASGDDTVKLWNAETGKCIRTMNGHKRPVLSVVYSPDGQQLASASYDNTVKLWDIEIGECIRTIRRESGVSLVAYSPNGQHLAFDSDYIALEIIDIATGKSIHTLQVNESPVLSITYSPDGQQLASTDERGLVAIWSTKTGRCTHALQGHEDAVGSVVYNSDGQLLASASYDSTVKLWNAKTGECIRTIKGHKSGVRFATYDPSNSQHIASAGSDSTVKLWNLTTGKCILTMHEHKAAINSVAYSPNGQQLASASDDKTIKLWDIETGNCIHTLKAHERSVSSITYSPNGQQLASASDDKTVKLWDIASRECVFTLQEHEEEVSSVVYSPNGRQLASDSGKMVKIWNIATGKCIHTLEEHKSFVWSTIYSPDGRQLASASGDGTVKLWNTDIGECINTLQEHEGSVGSVAYSPDGQKLASASSDHTLKLWDIQTGKSICTMKGHTEWVKSVVYSLDGEQLVSASNDGTIRIWDAATGECLCVIGDRVCEGLNITDTIGLSAGQRTALKIMGAIDHNDE